jgi:Helix-turn-helix domain
MSIQAVAWALDQDIRDPLAKLILISLANHADHTTGFCYPPMKLIAKEASCDRRTVIRKLPLLTDAGYIRIVPDREGKQRLAHYYQLLLPGCDPQSQPPPKKQSGLVAKRGPIVTRGCDSQVSTNNRQTTINSPLPPSPSIRISARGEKSGSQHTVSKQFIQNRIVERLGNGDVAKGWNLFGELPEAKQDELTAPNRGAARSIRIR